jgi:uncharacterized membrane protein YphA (DoxX/SURF4 family)
VSEDQKSFEDMPGGDSASSPADAIPQTPEVENAAPSWDSPALSPAEPESLGSVSSPSEPVNPWGDPTPPVENQVFTVPMAPDHDDDLPTAAVDFGAATQTVPQADAATTAFAPPPAQPEPEPITPFLAEPTPTEPVAAPESTAATTPLAPAPEPAVPAVEPTLVEQTLMQRAITPETLAQIPVTEPKVIPLPDPSAESLYRPPSPTVPMPTPPAPDAATPGFDLGAVATAPASALSAAAAPSFQDTLAGQREARERALGNVVTDDEDVAVDEIPQRDNDRFAGSFALFLLRLVLAAIVGVRGVQVVFHTSETAKVLEDLRVPEPTIFAWVLGGLLLLIALMSLLGFGARVAGFLVAALGICSLVFLRWGAFSPFLEGTAGFIGDFDLLVTVVGIVFLLLGSGGWGIDAAMRHGRQKRKLYS